MRVVVTDLSKERDLAKNLRMREEGLQEKLVHIFEAGRLHSLNMKLNINK